MKEVLVEQKSYIAVRFEGEYCAKSCQGFFEDDLDGPNMCGVPMCSLYGTREDQLKAEQVEKHVWKNKRCKVCRYIHGI